MEFLSVVTHVENKFKCSGFCKKPLFYLTQPITRGPPESPCLGVVIDDMGSLMVGLGAVILGTGVLFFVMIFLALPICRYSRLRASNEKGLGDADNERDAQDSQRHLDYQED